MDGVFMKKIRIITFTLGLLCLLGIAASFIADKATLQNGILRLHVVANSDEEHDQTQKLMVRDSVIAYLEPKLEGVVDKEQAMALIKKELSALKRVAEETLLAVGTELPVRVFLQKEEFDTREYETFSLPAGVYDALRIEIGNAEGKNWWCVVFPSLCLPAAGDRFAETAATVGVDRELSSTLTGTDGYEIHFFFLDCLGKLENFFHR